MFNLFSLRTLFLFHVALITVPLLSSDRGRKSMGDRLIPSAGFISPQDSARFSSPTVCIVNHTSSGEFLTSSRHFLPRHHRHTLPTILTFRWDSPQHPVPPPPERLITCATCFALWLRKCESILASSSSPIVLRLSPNSPSFLPLTTRRCVMQSECVIWGGRRVIRLVLQFTSLYFMLLVLSLGSRCEALEVGRTDDAEVQNGSMAQVVYICACVCWALVHVRHPHAYFCHSAVFCCLICYE